MKLIIAGSRGIDGPNVTEAAFRKSGFNLSDITEVVSGGARGVDTLGEIWAAENNLPVKVFKAEWDLYGRSAGYKRNQQMAEYSDALLCIWDEVSRGSKHMIDSAYAHGLKTYIYLVNREMYDQLRPGAK